MAPTARDQAPAAQITVPVSIRPRVVPTAVMVSPRSSMPVTSVWRRMRAPWARAALA